MAVRSGRGLLDDRDARFPEMGERDELWPSVLRFLKLRSIGIGSATPKEEKPIRRKEPTRPAAT
jgi:hypothetical protein